MSRTIEARGILADLRAGMDESALMRKYGLSMPDIRRIFQQIAHERQSRAKAIAVDLKAGMSDADLMKKHHLSADGFQRILETLVGEKLISMEDFTSRRTGAHDVLIGLRITPRYRPVLSITVCSMLEREGQCALRDISEQGLAVEGMSAQVGEIKKIAVLGDEFGTTAPFEFEAACRWTAQNTSGAKPVAGFQITKISADDMTRLQEFIQTATHAL